MPERDRLHRLPHANESWGWLWLIAIECTTWTAVVFAILSGWWVAYIAASVAVAIALKSLTMRKSDGGHG